MKFSVYALPAFAAFAFAGTALSDEKASSGDVWLDADELARGFDISSSPVDNAADGVNIQAISTKCAAKPRTGTDPPARLAQRSVSEMDEADLYDIMARQDGDCPSIGYLSRPGGRIFIKGVTYQRCANTCVCRGDYNGCLTFAWKPNGRGFGRGRCIIYTRTLAEMAFTPGMNPAGAFPTREFYPRTCFRRGEPEQSTQTQLAAQATPPPSKRDATLGDNLMAAMLQV